MTETQERFLRAVLTRVPLDSVVELHLFPPIRRGTMETGVAVIATTLPTEPLLAVAPEHDDELLRAVDEAMAPIDAVMVASPDVVSDTEIAVDASDGGEGIVVSIDIGDALMHVESGSDGEPLALLAIPWPRMRIFTASYRHTIKGVERGTWTFDVHEEADAPLEAVELVLRGVRHRSTEPADPEQVSHAALSALVTPARVAPAA